MLYDALFGCGHSCLHLPLLLFILQSFQVNATDSDAGLNGKVIYKIDNPSDDPFQINPFSKFLIKIVLIGTHRERLVPYRPE